VALIDSPATTQGRAVTGDPSTQNRIPTGGDPTIEEKQPLPRHSRVTLVKGEAKKNEVRLYQGKSLFPEVHPIYNGVKAI